MSDLFDPAAWCPSEWVGLRAVKRCGLPDPPPSSDLGAFGTWLNALHARTGAEHDIALVASMSAALNLRRGVMPPEGLQGAMF